MGTKRTNLKDRAIVGTIFLLILASFLAISIFWNASPVDNYDEIDPHRITCVQGAVLQPDGSCLDQE